MRDSNPRRCPAPKAGDVAARPILRNGRIWESNPVFPAYEASVIFRFTHLRRYMRYTGIEPVHSAWKADIIASRSIPLWPQLYSVVFCACVRPDDLGGTGSCISNSGMVWGQPR